MKKNLLLFALLLFSTTLWAQVSVKGKVTAEDDGSPLPGVSVLVKGTTTGVQTDADGNYAISAKSDQVLVFSFVGMDAQEISVGNQSIINVSLVSNANNLSEVVVTAIGIQREKKALGYGVTTLASQDVANRPEADIARVLRGKVPGVDITSVSGLAGSGTNVIIRGYSSITGSNQPLFVVDGVPFNSSTSEDRGFASGGATASSRFLDLDPNNIAEISVLKGLSATVLYGQQGRNGVVLVTTKGGRSEKASKKMEITLDQAFYGNQIASLPEVQRSYGNGFHNSYSQAFSNWGAAFDPGVHLNNYNWQRDNLRNPYNAEDGTITHPYTRGALASVFPDLQGARIPYDYVDNFSNFFQTGLVSNTSLNISKQLAGNTSINVNYGNRVENGFVSTSNYKKNNFGLGVSTKLANGLFVKGTFNYVNIDRVAPPAGVSFSSNPTGASLFSNIFYTPINIDLFGLPYENPSDRSSVYYRGGNDIQHPLWTLNNTSDNEVVNRFFGNVSATYDIKDWLSVTYRYGVDNYGKLTDYAINKGGRQIETGLYTTVLRNNTIQNHDLLLSFDKELSTDLVLNGVLGGNLRSDFNRYNLTSSSDQFVYGLLNHGNFINTVGNSGITEEIQMGAFLSASLEFRNYLFLNVQGRNDWTSTLEPGNNTIFYPSISASFVPTDAFPGMTSSRALNYLKLRLGYGSSAGYPNPYRTRNILSTSTRDFQTVGGAILNTNSLNNTFGNAGLRPELHTELEFGIESRLLDNRMGVDLSLYNKNSKDLIIDRQLDPSTGGTLTTVNAAAINNKGIELGLNYNIVKSKNVNWVVNANFTRNVGIIEALAEGIDQLVIDGYSSLGNFGIVGKPYGIIQGQVIDRNDKGEKIVNNNGLYQLAPEIGELGDPNPNYLLNGGTEITFKGLTLNALLSYQDGGVIYATTPSTLMSRGILAETDFDRFVPVIAPGVKGDGTPNDIQITSTQHYWRNGGVFIDEMRVYDATFLKLREISLSYSLPKKLIEKSPFSTIRLQVSGQNLWFNAFGFPPGANFDPEVLSLGVGNGRGFELMNVPTSRQFGGNIRLVF